MTVDGKLFVLTVLASTTTVLVIVFQAGWIRLTYALRKRGRRVTYLHHNWHKIQEAIASVDQPTERARYERWSSMLRWTYAVWALTMITLALVSLYIFKT